MKPALYGIEVATRLSGELAATLTAGAPDAQRKPCALSFDPGDDSPAELMEAMERLFADWPAARVPLKRGAAAGTVCGCGQAHGSWVCSHCTPS
jgi:hypothetical protein